MGTADVSRWLEQGLHVLWQIHGLKAEKSVKGIEPRDFTPQRLWGFKHVIDMKGFDLHGPTPWTQSGGRVNEGPCLGMIPLVRFFCKFKFQV